MHTRSDDSECPTTLPARLSSSPPSKRAGSRESYSTWPVAPRWCRGLPLAHRALALPLKRLISEVPRPHVARTSISSVRRQHGGGIDDKGNNVGGRRFGEARRELAQGGIAR